MENQFLYTCPRFLGPNTEFTTSLDPLESFLKKSQASNSLVTLNAVTPYTQNIINLITLYFPTTNMTKAREVIAQIISGEKVIDNNNLIEKLQTGIDQAKSQTTNYTNYTNYTIIENINSWSLYIMQRIQNKIIISTIILILLAITVIYNWTYLKKSISLENYVDKVFEEKCDNMVQLGKPSNDRFTLRKKLVDCKKKLLKLKIDFCRLKISQIKI